MNTNIASARSRASPSGPATVSSASCSSPCAAVTDAPVRTSMFSCPAIWSIRYCDMLFSSASPRQRIVTCAAYLAKCIAAWPAEFAPPTTNTRWSAQDTASATAAP